MQESEDKSAHTKVVCIQRLDNLIGLGMKLDSVHNYLWACIILSLRVNQLKSH